VLAALDAIASARVIAIIRVFIANILPLLLIVPKQTLLEESVVNFWRFHTVLLSLSRQAFAGMDRLI
jgi:hypothetical protein